MVSPFRRQHFVRQKASNWEIGDELARRTHQRLKQLAPLAPPEIERDRFLGAVEIFPIERIIRRRDRPAPKIGAAANLIDADHFRAELSAIQASRR